MVLAVLVFWFCTSSAQTPDTKPGGKFKPQVVGAEGAAAPTDAAWASPGRPQVLPNTPVPVGPQQPPAVPGQPTPHYGSRSISELLNDLANKLGKDVGEYYDGDSGVGGQYYGPGYMEDCGQAPPSAEKAYNEAKNFRQTCAPARRGENQKIAVNDYSTRPSWMYIFDLNGKCLKKTMVSFGNGAGGKQLACSDDGKHLTPPGFHLTAEHHGGGKYGPNNSMKMVALQGQNSAGRGVLIHEARAPGTSSSWGCSGVGYAAFPVVKKMLGYGALVYNYFSPEQMANGCNNRGGQSLTQCQSPEVAVPPVATGEATSVTLNWWPWLRIQEAWARAFPPRLKIRKGTQITILRELVASRTFEVEMVKEDAQGPNVARPQELIKALGLRDSLKTFRKRLNRDSGAVYTLRQDLPLLWPEEIFRLQDRR